MSFISWIVGMLLNAILMKSAYYDNLSNLNFIKSKHLNKKIGLKPFKWIVKNTFFKFFNQKIKVENQNDDLTEIRKEMTFSEISHLIGFTFVTIFVCIMLLVCLDSASAFATFSSRSLTFCLHAISVP